MKKQLLFGLFAAMFLQMLSFGNAQAGTVTIGSAMDSTWGPLCPPPQNIDYLIWGNTTGYIVGTDSITIDIDFGDGNDTTFKTPISPSFFGWALHTYTISGQFTVTYIATGPDLAADTLIVYNEIIIGDTCGTIDGQVYLDPNNDCIYNAGDIYLQGIQVKLLLNNQVVGWDWTDVNGHYWFDAPINFAYDIELANMNWWGYTPTCPANGTIAVPNAPSSGNDFAVDCLNGFDLSGHVWGGSVPGQNTPLHTYAYNSTCLATSGTAKLVLDDPYLTYVSANPAPAYVSGDTVAWNFTNLTNGWWNTFYANLQIYTSPSAQIGDTVCVTLIVEPIVGDNNPADNVQQFCIPVTASYDPNNKSVSPLGSGSQGKIAQNVDLTYTINFQNTGTATAYNIYLLDTLQDADLDLDNIQLLGTSHNVAIDIIDGNVLKFRFDDIMLPDSATNMAGSMGWVTYRIKQQLNLPNGTQINNTAGIFFDYNPAVITNTTLNTIDISLSIETISSTSGKFAEVYPNPASSELNISFGNDFEGEVVLVDLLGKVVMSKRTDKDMMQINVSELPSGIYALIIKGKDKVQREKIVVTR